MKNSYKFLLVALCLIGTLFGANAQEEEVFEPTPVPSVFFKTDRCKKAHVKTSYLIGFESGIDGFVEFDEKMSNVEFREIGGRQVMRAIFENGVFVLPNLKLGVTYEILAPNSCGRPEVVTTLQAGGKDGVNTEEFIVVSGELFNAISYFSSGQARQPFRQFLNELRTVSYFEKVAFFQKYLLKGKKIRKGINPFLTIDTGDDDEDDEDDDWADGCNCVPVYTSELITPGTIVGFPKTTVPEVSFSGTPQDPKIQLGGTNAAWWWADVATGAAKWQGVWSEGWKARRNQTITASMGTLEGTNSNVSVNESSLSYNLFCLDYSLGLPVDCDDCVKEVTLNYRYDTYMNATASIGGGGGSKLSSVGAQDFAVVTLQEGNGIDGIQVLSAGDLRVEALCEQEENVGFWLNALDIAATIGQIAVAGGVPTSDQIDGLKDNISDMVQNPLYYYDEECSGGVIATQPLVGGTTVTELRSNRPIVLKLYSFSNFQVKGMRSWYNHAYINSDFLLSGFVTGGYNPDREPVYCCGDQIATWLLSSEDGPQTKESLKAILGQQFVATENINPTAWSFPIAPGNTIEVPGDSGYDVVPILDCDRLQDEGRMGKVGDIQSGRD